MTPIELSQWQIISVLGLFPLVYFVNSFSPWSRRFFVEKNRAYRKHFFLSIHFLHYATSAIAIAWLAARGISARNIGLDVSHGLIAFLAILLVGLVLAQTRIEAKPSAPGGHETTRTETFTSLLAPTSLAERRAYVITCLTAGFCEEFLYRGVGILALQGAGVPTWISLAIAALSFAAIHGRACLSTFGCYLVLKGMLYGWLFLYSQSLLLVIVLHTLWDIFLLLKPVPSLTASSPELGS